MLSLLTDRPVYSRAERLSDAAVHVLGVGAALIAVPVVVTLAVRWHGDTGTVTAALVYGATLLAMLTCSALYNITHGCAWTGVFKRLDHTAIFFKIAGTYTPFAVLSGAPAGRLLAALWGVAVAGAALKILAPYRFKLLSITLCIAMGWTGLIFGEEIVAALSPEVYSLMLAGGLLYTTGVFFFLWASLPFHNTIWHVFVLAATAVFYVAIVVQLGHGPSLPAGAPPPLHASAEAG